MPNTIALTYTAPLIRLVVVHDRPVVHTAPSCAVQAAAISNRHVFFAKYIVEYDCATWIPPEHLNGQLK